MNEKLQPKTVDSKIERPPYVYHGSVDGDVVSFVPRSATERPDEEAAVYASPNIEIAKQSMANRFVTNGGVVNGRHFVCIPMTKENFIKKDTGGYLYKLPCDSFAPNEGRGFGDDEWVSYEDVHPLSVEYFPSLYDVLIGQGTEVYFITSKQVGEIEQLQDGDPEELERYLNVMK
jgi:hypothetical protein